MICCTLFISNAEKKFINNFPSFDKIMKMTNSGPILCSIWKIVTKISKKKVCVFYLNAKPLDMFEAEA